jgi:hypothetical protein
MDADVSLSMKASKQTAHLALQIGPFRQIDTVVDNRSISSISSVQKMLDKPSGGRRYRTVFVWGSGLQVKTPICYHLPHICPGTVPAAFLRILASSGNERAVCFPKNSISFRYRPWRFFASAENETSSDANRTAVPLQLVCAALFLAADEAALVSDTCLFICADETGIIEPAVG